MSEFKVASRYAKSLIDLAQEQGNLDEIKVEMEQFMEVLKSNSELLAVLRNPIIKQDKKINILDGVFQGKLNPLVVSFFHLLIKKGRGEVLFSTSQEFIREYNEVKGIVKATVTSAAPMSETNLGTLRDQISKQINATIILENKVDPALIGGFIVTVGDRQIDTSILGKLNKLERHFQA